MIYKYYSGNSYSLESLKKQEFWFSKPTEFNDPFDCNMDILDNYPAFKEKLFQKSPDLIKSFQDAVKHFGICCFSDEGDNMHLWSLYANSYKGFALEFDETEFEDYFSNLFSAKCNLLSAKYTETLLNLDNGSIVEKNIESDGTENGTISKPVASFLADSKKFDKLLEYLICQKNEKIWSVENEKRLIIGGLARSNGAKRFEYQFGYSVPWKRNSLKRIIIGHRMSQSEKVQVRDIVNQIDANIEILQTSLDYINWKVILEPLILTF